MSDAQLNAPIIIRHSGSSGDVPSALDLQVGELALNTADGALYTRHYDNSVKQIAPNNIGLDGLTDVDTSTTPPTDGQVLAWVDANSKWEPADVDAGGGGGATVLDELTDVDTSTTPPLAAQVLAYDGTEWVPVETSGVQMGSPTWVENNSTIATYPLCGIDGFYADNSAMTDDGFIFIAGTNNLDDSAATFSPGANWDGIDFMGNGILSSNWFINSNGAVGWDVDGNTTSARNASALVNGANIDFYVSIMTADAELRRAGFREFLAEGKNWLVVRCEFKVPYNSETNGYVAEVWFGADGSLSVRYGTKVNSGNDITVGANKNTVVSNGVAISANPYTGLTPGGAYVYNYLYTAGQLQPGSGTSSIDNLTDVDTTTTPPEDNQVLTWSTSASNWIPGGKLTGNTVNALVLQNFNSATDPDDFGVTNVNANLGVETAPGVYEGRLVPDAASAKFGAGGVYFENDTYTQRRIEVDGLASYAPGTSAWTIAFWWKSSEVDYTGKGPTDLKHILDWPFTTTPLNIAVRPTGYTPDSDAVWQQPVGPGGAIFLATASYDYDWGIGTGNVCDGIWHHIAFQCSGADDSGNATYTCFVDGVLTQSYTGTALDFTAKTTEPEYQVELGCIRGDLYGGVIASMDSFAFYDGAIYNEAGFGLPTGPHTAAVTVGGYLSISDFKDVVAASTDFADFQSRVAAL